MGSVGNLGSSSVHTAVWRTLQEGKQAGLTHIQAELSKDSQRRME